MENFEPNEQLIADYLDDKMSGEEEMVFMRKLGEDNFLRKQFEDELLMRSLFENDEQEYEVKKTAVEENLLSKKGFLLKRQSEVPNDPLLESTKKGTKTVEKVSVKRDKKQIDVVLPIFRRYTRHVAAILLIITGALAYYFIRHSQSQNTDSNAFVKKMPVKFDTSQNHGILIDEEKSKNIFFKFNTPYSSSTDPVQVSLYYNYYKHAQYTRLFETKEEEVMQAGGNDEKFIWNAYLHFYKGLAYLAHENSKKDNAIKEFNLALKDINQPEPLYYKAQWYMALAWLQNTNKEKTYSIAKKIASSNSPFKYNAQKLMVELTAK